ncbi:phosphotransferase-like protein, partial [Mycobacterium tuberculosis]
MINPTRARRMRYRLAAMAGMPEGKLILLNGGSSAGKTSLALAFQDLAAECWMHIGIDLFWFALPPEQLDLARVR